MKSNLSLATRTINAGSPPAKQGQAFRKGPEFASTFHLAGDVDPDVFQYARFGHPTWEALEQGLSELEGAASLVFPSGMSAAAAILTSLLEPGQHLLLPSDGYSPVRVYAETYLCKFGVELSTIASKDIDNYDFKGISLALLESPSNPMLDTFDIALAAKKMKQQGGLLAVDNTTLTFLGQQPLKLGADISMCADTKALNGHSDVLFGHVSCIDEQILNKIKNWRKLSGNVPGPMETWLVHRSLSSLDLRLQRMCENAMQLALALQEHPKVKAIRYPGLTGDPSFKLASKQQDLFGFLISFDLGSKTKAERFLENCILVHSATSFGGVHSTAERRARWGSDDIGEGVLRFSVGCERLDDLLKDVLDALQTV